MYGRTDPDRPRITIKLTDLSCWRKRSCRHFTSHFISKSIYLKISCYGTTVCDNQPVVWDVLGTHGLKVTYTVWCRRRIIIVAFGQIFKPLFCSIQSSEWCSLHFPLCIFELTNKRRSCTVGIECLLPVVTCLWCTCPSTYTCTCTSRRLIGRRIPLMHN